MIVNVYSLFTFKPNDLKLLTWIRLFIRFFSEGLLLHYRGVFKKESIEDRFNELARIDNLNSYDTIIIQ